VLASDEGGESAESSVRVQWALRTITGRVRIAPAVSTSPVRGTKKGVASKGEGREVHDLDLRLAAGLRRHGW